MTFSKRVVLVALVCCVQLLYIPTSSRVEGGIEPKLSIDIFPLWPIWVLPYVLCYIFWFSSFVWAVRNMEDRWFRAFIAACLLTFSVGIFAFIFFPTYVRPATFAGNDIFTILLRSIHESWGRYDAFPSGHVYITTLLLLFFNRLYPSRKFLWISILAVVSLSTLFTGQHYILDVVGGYVAALAGYHFGLWWAGFYPAQRRSGKRSGKSMASSLN